MTKPRDESAAGARRDEPGAASEPPEGRPSEAREEGSGRRETGEPAAGSAGGPDETSRSGPDKDKRSDRARRIGVRVAFVLLMLGTLGAAFGAGAYLTLRHAVDVPDVVVPELVGLDAPEARRAIESRDLAVEIIARRYDAGLPADTVLEQFPAPGQRTKPGRPVRLVLSLGAERAVVPEVEGSSLRRAQLALRAAGLRVESTASAPSAEIPLGRVIAQDPPAGREGYPGDGVSLLLSAGPAQRALVMPALTGRSVDEVRRLLERAGFRRIRVRGPEGQGAPPSARVIDQHPRPGSRVTTDARVLLETGPRALEERR